MTEGERIGAEIEEGFARHAPQIIAEAVVGLADADLTRNRERCRHGDPFCPCQDGDPCHYEDAPGSPAMT